MKTFGNLCVAAFVALLAACGGGGGEAAPTPARAASAALGPGGGSLEAVLEGGTTVRLNVPAGAVSAVTTFRIDPGPSTPDRLGVFTLAPAGVPFVKPVEMTVTLSAELAQKADVVLLLESGDGAVAASGPADPASRTLRARFDELPVAPTAAQAAGRARPLSAVPPGTRAAAADPEAIAIAALASQRFEVQLADLVRRVMVLTQLEGSIANAVGVQFAFQGILDRNEGPSNATVRVQAQAWRTFICGQRSFAVSALDSFNGLDTQTFGVRMRDAGVWGRQAESMGHTVVDLEPPLAACDGAPVTYLQPLSEALERYAPRLSDALDAENTGGSGFDLILNTRLPELLVLDRELGQFGLASSLLLDLAKRQIDTLRITAYDDCRIRHTQQRQRRLLDRLVGDLIFAGVSRFDAVAMLQDVQFCGMTLVWEVLAADGDLLNSGRAGGLPRPPGTLPTVAVGIGAGATLRLNGPPELGLTALVCPVPSADNKLLDTANNEQLVVTLQAGSGAATELARLTPANDNTYLSSNQLDFEVARLGALVAAAGGAGRLVVKREGGLCNGEFANLGAHATITTLELNLDDTLLIKTATLPPGLAGTPYSAVLEVDGGAAPLTWTASGLPPGLALKAATGAISGTPTEVGDFNPIITVVSSSGSTASATLSLRVAMAIPTLWAGTISYTRNSSYSLPTFPPVPYFSSTETFTSEKSIERNQTDATVAVPVEVTLLAVDGRTPAQVATGTPVGSAAFTSSVETFQEYFATNRPGCKLTSHSGSSLTLGSVTSWKVPSRAFNLVVSADGSYTLDASGAVSASGPMNKRSFSFRTADPEGCYSTSGGDFTEVIQSGAGVSGKVPLHRGVITNGRIVGSAVVARDLSELSNPQPGQTFTDTLTVTWDLQPR